jgi:hypothetical protein
MWEVVSWFIKAATPTRPARTLNCEHLVFRMQSTCLALAAQVVVGTHLALETNAAYFTVAPIARHKRVKNFPNERQFGSRLFFLNDKHTKYSIGDCLDGFHQLVIT